MTTPPGVHIYRDFLYCAGPELEAPRQRLRPCAAFLGNFNYRFYGEWGGRYHGKLPQALRAQAQRMAALVPDEVFNAAFLQRYRQGEFVRKHRDPKNNHNCTLIGLFGNWEGAVMSVGNAKIQGKRGDVIRLPTTVDGRQGPVHSVSPVLRGTRWALILCSIMD